MEKNILEDVGKDSIAYAMLSFFMAVLSSLSTH